MKAGAIFVVAAIVGAVVYIFYQLSKAKTISQVNNPGIASPAGPYPSNNALARYVAPGAPTTRGFTGIAMFPTQAQLTGAPVGFSPDLNGTLPLAPAPSVLSSPLDYGAPPALATGIESPGTDIFSSDSSLAFYS